MRWFKRAFADAALAMAAALARVSASYGQDKQEVVRIGGVPFFAPGLVPQFIRISDAARRPGS